MGTAGKAVMVFVKEFQWDQRPQLLQNGLIHHQPPACTNGGQDIKKNRGGRVPKSGSGRRSSLTSNLLKHIFFKIPDLVHMPTAAEIAARWPYRLPIKNLTPQNKRQFCVSLLFCIDQEAHRRLQTRLNWT